MAAGTITPIPLQMPGTPLPPQTTPRRQASKRKEAEEKKEAERSKEAKVAEGLEGANPEVMHMIPHTPMEEATSSTVRKADDDFPEGGSPKAPRTTEAEAIEEVRRIKREAHGDEEDPWEMIDIEEMERENIGEHGISPRMTDEELDRLDKEATKEEITRLSTKMNVLEELKKEEEDEYEDISSKMVITWKNRQEKGGWFRRARLVARQFKSNNDEDMANTFAPTSVMMVPKLLIHLMMTVYVNFVAMVLDIKDAFLMVDQPADEKASIRYGMKRYKLKKCLPGQRTAARHWFDLFKDTAIEFGMESNPLQPTLLMKFEKIYLTVHVDDVLMIGKPEELNNFVRFLEKKSWKTEVNGPFEEGSTNFNYLKREFELNSAGCIVRPDTKRIRELAKVVMLQSHHVLKKVPGKNTFNKKDESTPLEAHEITEYRSCVGRLMYIASERPDAQHCIQSLAKKMSKPTTLAMEHVKHLASYLWGTIEHGVLIENSKPGKSVLDMRNAHEVEDRGGPRR